MGRALPFTEKLAQEFAVIARLGPTSVQGAVESVRSSPNIATRGALRRAIAKGLGAANSAADVLERHLFSIVSYQALNGWGPKEALEAVSAGLKDALSPEDFRSWQSTEEDVLSLLSLEAVQNVERAVNLAFDRARLFETVRVLTDVRPVFVDNAEEFKAVVIVQTLKLTTWSEGVSHHLNLVMEPHELEELKAACERALHKATACERVMERAGLTVFHSIYD